MRCARWIVSVAAFVIGLAGAARADEPAGRGAPLDRTEDWEGVWTVEGSGEPRFIVTTPSGLVALTLDLNGVQVQCSGTHGADLRLTGRVTTTIGVVGVLQQREGETEPVPVTAHVSRLAPDPETGDERARSRVSARGRVVRDETWTRPGRPSLRLVRADAGVFDPTQGPLQVRVRVGGQAQRVRLEVALPPRCDSDRNSFYMRDKGLRDRVVRSVGGDALLPPGEHVLEWDGRDRTGDRRLALGGDYVLRVRSPEVPDGEGTEARITVQQPRAIVQAPTFAAAVSDQAATFGGIADRLEGYRVERVSATSSEAFLEGLRRSAVTVIDTHGAPNYFAVKDGDGVMTWDVEGLASATQKPLRDVHAVFVIACKVGAIVVHQPNQGPPIIACSLVDALKNGGVDVVVTFTGSILQSEVSIFDEELGLRLLCLGVSIERAVQDAASESFERWWNGRGLSWWARRDREREVAAARKNSVSAMKEVLRVDVAPGIDRNAETLFPPRHGCSTN